LGPFFHSFLSTKGWLGAFLIPPPQKKIQDFNFKDIHDGVFKFTDRIAILSSLANKSTYYSDIKKKCDELGILVNPVAEREITSGQIQFAISIFKVQQVFDLSHLKFDHSLYDKNGKDLFESLQKLFYSKKFWHRPLIMSKEGIVFKPTNMFDHFATPFLKIESKGENERLLKISVSYAGSPKPFTNVIIQDENYNQLGTINEYINNGITKDDIFTKLILLPVTSDSLRLVISNYQRKASYMPSSIKIEQARCIQN